MLESTVSELRASVHHDLNTAGSNPSRVSVLRHTARQFIGPNGIELNVEYLEIISPCMSKHFVNKIFHLPSVDGEITVAYEAM